MSVLIVTITLSVFLVSASCEEPKIASDPKLSSSHEPTSIDSRFFGLPGFINHLFPGLAGNQGGLNSNPSGIDIPANSNFYPNQPIQGQPPAVQPGQGNFMWPDIDDASRYPNNGNIGAPRPPFNQGGLGGYPQGGIPQYPPNPNLGMGGPYPGYPQYPVQDGGAPNSQYPNQGNLFNTPRPNQGAFNNPGNFGGVPNSPQNPNQGNFMNPGNPNQGNVPQYPNLNNGGSGPMQNEYPNQGPWNQNSNNFGTGMDGSDGTLDSLVPPQSTGPWDSNMPNDFSPEDTQPDDENQDGMFSNGNPSNGNAILGRPVQVPESTTDAGQITFPDSTQSPIQRQCVQDCETTSEYNPVCGSDGVTYINPGKFVCARNCGINVFVNHRGRCPDDTPNPRNVINVSRPSFAG